eukprot:1151768-Pelagomonas_calceolata.AAC.3
MTRRLEKKYIDAEVYSSWQIHWSTQGLTSGLTCTELLDCAAYTDAGHTLNWWVLLGSSSLDLFRLAWHHSQGQLILNARLVIYTDWTKVSVMKDGATASSS